MLRIVRAEAFEVALPFRREFRHALSSRRESASVVVRLVDARGRRGHGEGAPRPYVTGETLDTAREALRDHFFPALLAARLDGLTGAVAWIGERLLSLPRTRRAAFCAVELALLDLASRAEGRSAGDVLGPVVRPRVSYGGVVSAEGPRGALELCAALAELGFRDVKLKLGRSRGEDREVLLGAREVLGADCTLRGDANGAFDLAAARERVPDWVAAGLAAIEQPLPAEDLGGLAALASECPVPLCADESVADVADVRALARRGACRIVNVRVSKCGGLLGSLGVIEAAREEGLDWMLGAQVGETSLLSAAGRLLATRVEGARWCEGSYGTLLLEEDLAEPEVRIGAGGAAGPVEGPGLATEPTARRLASHARALCAAEAGR